MGLEPEVWDEDRTLLRSWMYFTGSSWNPSRLFDSPPNVAVPSPSGRYYYVNRLLRSHAWYPAPGSCGVCTAFDDDVVIPEIHDVTFTDNTIVAVHPLGILNQRSLWERACGRVVHGGLGAGWLLRKLHSVPEVDRLTLVEIDQELIGWIGPRVFPGLDKVERVVWEASGMRSKSTIRTPLDSL